MGLGGNAHARSSVELDADKDGRLVYNIMHRVFDTNIDILKFMLCGKHI